jgi:hypothetical protein
MECSVIMKWENGEGMKMGNLHDERVEGDAVKEGKREEGNIKEKELISEKEIKETWSQEWSKNGRKRERKGV